MFGVMWRNEAMDSLADSMVRANLERQHASEQAVLRLNRQLADAPLAIGESRDDLTPITLEDHCDITYMVNHPDDPEGIIRVTYFWTFE